MNSEKQTFDRLLKTIGENSALIRDKKLSGFCAQKGSKYRGELIIYGRAVNGWGKFDVKGQTNKIKRANSLNEIFKGRKLKEADPSYPLSWVSKDWGKTGKDQYNPARSAFWRVVRELVNEMHIADVENDCWSSYLAWSNLYKISPYEGGNPSERLAAIQFSDCAQLLQYELNEWSPKRILFLTGKDWFDDFSDLINISPSKGRTGKYVELVGKLDSRKSGITAKVVVAKHPQGKSEEPFVREVFRAFEA